MKTYIKFFVVIVFASASITLIAQNCVQCSGGNASGNNASIIGIDNTASGTASFAGGLDSQSLGKESFAFGDSARAMSPYSIALGKEVMAFGGSSVALGKFLRTTISSSMVIGYGFDEYNYLENSQLNSIIFGCNSNKPTLFVGPSVGLGYTGKVGIGDITDPLAKLHIKADNGEDVDILLEPGGADKFAKLKFGSTSNRIEALGSSDLRFYTAEDFNFVGSNVGIGTPAPTAKLDVNGTLRISDIAKFDDKVGIGTGSPNHTLEVDGDMQVSSDSYFLGNVGIGTSSPASLLHIEGTAGNSESLVHIHQASLTDAGKTLYVTNSDDAAEALACFDNSGIGATAIFTGGNIGIGTTQPESLLHLFSKNSQYPSIRLESPDSINGGNSYWEVLKNTDKLYYFYQDQISEQDTQFVFKDESKFGIRNINPLAEIHIGDIWTFNNPPDARDKIISYNGFTNDDGITYKRITKDKASAIKFSNTGSIIISTAIDGNQGTPITFHDALMVNDNKVAINDELTVLATTTTQDLIVNNNITTNSLNSNTIKVDYIDAKPGTIDAGTIDSDHLYCDDIHTTNFWVDETLYVNTVYILDNLVYENLFIDGKLECGELEISQQDWKDEVFEEDYNLPSLSQVEQYIKENHHLKDIPSEAEVIENGINVGEMNALLLQKIEELTLYVIELKKEINEFKKD